MFRYLNVLVALMIIYQYAGAQSGFTSGNLVVYRVGDGTAVLNGKATQVFLDEYTISGQLVQSIPMPVAGSKLTAGGNFSKDGLLTLSGNGRLLALPGYNATVGADPFSGAGQRSIALVDFNGTVKSVTVLPNPDYWPISSAVTDNGTNLWFTGSDGLDYAVAGSSAFSRLIDYGYSSFTEAALIQNGQLYLSHIYSGYNAVGQVGSGLPITPNQNFNEFPGLGGSLDPMQFALLDLNASVPGADVLYISAQASTGGGVRKFSLVNNLWVSNGAVGTGADLYHGLTARVMGNTVQIFASRKGNNSTSVAGGEIVLITDNAGYNANMVAAPQLIASAGVADRKAFRGLAFAPTPAPFTAGNFVAYRVGSGSSVLNSKAAPVYIDEYSPTGTLVQSILLPTIGKKLTAGGNFTNDGLLNLSEDGKILAIPGYNTPVGIDPFSGAAERSVGLMNYDGLLTNVSNLPNPDFWPITSAVTDNGTNIWYAGSDGVERVPATGTQITKVIDYGYSAFSESLGIFSGQLFMGQSFSGDNYLGTVGIGLPTTANQNFAQLPGLTGIDPYQFAFADLDPAVPGNDVLYVASQLSTGGGVRKFSLVNGLWTARGNIGSGGDKYAGLAVRVSGTSVRLFLSRKGGNSASIGGGEIVTVQDNSGYGGNLSGTPQVVVTVGSADTKAYRGLALVAQGCQKLIQPAVINITSSQATLTWTAPLGTSNFEYFVSTSATPPATGTPTNQTTVTITGLTNAVNYFAHVRTRCSALSASDWVTIPFVTSCKSPVSISTVVSAAGGLQASWNPVFGAQSYEYSLSSASASPAAGTLVTDTFFLAQNLNAVTQYYIHVRTSCGSGAFSNWLTRPLLTGCFQPVPQVQYVAAEGAITWTGVVNVKSYEYALTTSSAKPHSGIRTAGTSYQLPKLNSGSKQFFHIRSICASGASSEWKTIPIEVAGLLAHPSPVVNQLSLTLFGNQSPNGSIIITDVRGRTIFSGKMQSSSMLINTAQWSAGLYFVNYQDEQNSFSKKIIKN